MITSTLCPHSFPQSVFPCVCVKFISVCALLFRCGGLGASQVDFASPHTVPTPRSITSCATRESEDLGLSGTIEMSSGTEGMSAGAAYCVYQCVDLDVDMMGERAEGSTTLWLLFRKPVEAGSVICLHNRCLVREVLVNNVASDFQCRDALSTLYFDKSRVKNYSGKEADVNYKAALELSREGELQIVVPPGNLLLEDLPDLPREAALEIHERFSKLRNVLGVIKNEMEDHADESTRCRHRAGSGDDFAGAEEEKGGASADSAASCRLLQIKIKYSVPRRPEKNCCGIVFRQSVASKLAATSDVGGAWLSVGGAAAGAEKPIPLEEAAAAAAAAAAQQNDISETGAVCVYTVGAGGDGVLRDVDGVRCWVPCIDSPEQRPVFDVTIRAQANMMVLCSGKQVSRLPVVDGLSSSSSSSLMEVTSLRRVESRVWRSEQAGPMQHFATRFVTPVRTPAFSVGFFVGVVEVHAVPLYKVRGRAWVALGLADSVRADAQKKGKEDSNAKIGQRGAQGGSRGRSDTLTSDPSDTYAELAQRERKRARVQGSSGSAGDAMDDDDPSTTNRRLRSMSFGAVASSRWTDPGESDSADRERERLKRNRATYLPSLYEAALRHTVGRSGLDMSLRVLHKFVGHRYDHDTYTQVFIEGLGDHFLSFDGFSLLDAQLLHTEEQAFMESPVHLLLMRAYLYSWLMAAIPLDSFDSGFVLHGAVGYLQDLYVDQVYGEEDSVARLQKYTDTCNELDKLGFAFPLTSGHPDSYDHLSPYHRVYCTAKSTVLFHLLETHIGGRDSMRLALQALVKSPSLYKTTSAPSPLSHAGGGRCPSDPFAGEDDSQPSLSRQSSTNSAYGATPFHFGPGSNPQTAFPQPTPHPAYPLLFPNSGPATGPPTLKRQDSITSELGWEADPLSLMLNCVSVDSFFAELRTCASAIIELPEEFANQFIHSCGTHLLYISASLDPKTEGKARNFNVNVSSMSCRNGNVNKGLTPPMELKLRVVEQRDDVGAECTIVTNDNLEAGEVHSQVIHAKQIRQRFKQKRKHSAKPTPAQELENAERLSREKLRHRKLREHLMDSLELAREMEHPVKYICPDASSAAMFEAHLQLPDPLLIELLFSERDSHDVLRHILALRSMGRMNPAAGNVTNSIELSSPAMLHEVNAAWSETKGPPRSARLQLKALSDCLMGTCISSKGDARCITSPHHPSVRVEAAFALAAWQNNRAPRYSQAHEADASRTEVDPWGGLAVLNAALRDLFTLNGVAAPIDSTSETSSKLRHSILLAVSSIRSQLGYTPQPAVDAIWQFASCCDDVVDDPLKSRSRSSGGRAKGSTATDNSHYKGVLLLALSQLRPDPNAGDAYTKVLPQIRDFAKRCLQYDWTVARTTARIAARPDEPSRMPCLALSGGITALCLHCLAEIDIYHLHVESLRGPVDVVAMHRQLQTGRGHFTGINYCAYFLPVGTSIAAMRVEEEGISEKFFATCPAVVRAAGLEAVTRLLFATHNSAWDRAGKMADPQAKAAEMSRVKGMACVATALAAVFTVIHNDPSRWTRRQAALTLQNAILDRRARLPLLALALGDVGGCIKWSDPDALTLRPSRVSSTFHSRLFPAPPPSSLIFLYFRTLPNLSCFSAPRAAKSTARTPRWCRASWARRPSRPGGGSFWTARQTRL